jgi:ABC-2 type transport system permease protein
VTRLVRAELLKLRTTRLWWGLLLGAVLLTGFAAIATLAVANTPQAAQNGVTPVRTASDVADFIAIGTVGPFFALVLGITLATGEHRYGTIGATYLAVPRRYLVVIAKGVSAVAAGVLFAVVTTALALVIVAVKFLIDGATLPLSGTVVARFFAVALLGAYAGAMGVGIGTAVRSQLVAILGVLGFRLILEPLLGSLFHVLREVTPFAGTEAALTQSQPEAMQPAVAILVIVAYAAVAAMIGVWLEQRRDV